MHRGTTVSAQASTTRTTKTAVTIPGRRRRKPVRLAPITARDAEVEIGHTLMPAPWRPGEFDTVAINRRVDILAAERGTGRITEAQFMVGRMIQAIYERGSGARLGSGGWGNGGSRDQTVAHELAIIFAIEDAEKVKKFTDRLEQAIGAVGARFLRAILTEGHSFSTYAAARGRSGELGVRSVAERFRWLLEALTEAQHTAVGPGNAPIRGERVENLN